MQKKSLTLDSVYLLTCVCATYQSIWQTARGRFPWVQGVSCLQQQLLTQRGNVVLCVRLQTELQRV